MLDTTRISRQITEVYADSGDLDVSLTFDIEGEEYPAEPTSWGASRGTEVEMTAEVVKIRIGRLHGDRNTAERIFGAAHLDRIEKVCADEMTEKYTQGELA